MEALNRRTRKNKKKDKQCSTKQHTKTKDKATRRLNSDVIDNFLKAIQNSKTL